jgi:hypothetical protein
MSKDTSEFCCDCIKEWWENYGKIHYWEANSILALADCGGSNSCRHYIFKEDLQRGCVHESLTKCEKASISPVFEVNVERFLCLRFSITHTHDQKTK